MIGSSLKVDFVFAREKTKKEIFFPKNTKWLNLNTMEPIFPTSDNKTYSVMVDASIDHPVNMF
jgi:hypothetical protein